MRFLPTLLISALLGSSAASAAPDCAALAAERARLKAEHDAGAAAIAEIALGKSEAESRKQQSSAGQFGRMAAGTAAGLLLPFPLGTLLGLGSSAARRAARAKEQGQPDVAAMIRRQSEIEARLAAIDAEGCPAATAPTEAHASATAPTEPATAPSEEGRSD
jgi:hypothetical protein